MRNGREAAVRGTRVRPRALGKSLYLGERELPVRGVTYGTFSPSAGNDGFPPPDVVTRDFAAMAAVGANAVRTYSTPPVWLLDLAGEAGLHVLAGLPWEEHVAFLDDRGRARSIRRRVAAAARGCARHPAILAYTVGNEIPAPIVRWHGRSRIEHFLGGLYDAVKDEDPDGLVTYANFPSTEYLHLPFTDLVCFNVFVESAPQFEGYLARLNNLAGDRPLLITELGLDSRRHGLEAQARTVEHQVRASFPAGCAGVFVFSWTDEWCRGGVAIDDWDFGLVDRDRRPKPALAAVQHAFAEVPFEPEVAWPKVSVVVCVYNGEETLRDCLEGVDALDYPDVEVIVIDDGSTDSTSQIAAEFDCRLIRANHAGLAAARNAGLTAATGEIVAFLDADARPEPSWLSYLAHALLSSSHSGVGGPNIPPAGDGLVAAAVANAPGGPIHVLLTDREAEHIPGCNMAFWKSALDAIGGFDPVFQIAGDDVDVCWRIHECDWTLGFSPGAVVWHRRRRRVRDYLRQQYQYGKAEALLERKWPEKYNGDGHVTWAGRVYGNGSARLRRTRRWRVYYGVWGTGAFQREHEPSASLVATLPFLPEWYLGLAGLTGVAALGVLWAPLLLALPLLVIAVCATLADAALLAARHSLAERSRRKAGEVWCLTACLIVLQPPARMLGRLRGGLAPWRKPGSTRLSWPAPRTKTVWTERWRAHDETVGSIARRVRALGATVVSGGPFDRWDLEVRLGLGAAARALVAVEEHGHGRQLLRIRYRPKPSHGIVVAAPALMGLGALAVLDGASEAGVLLAVAGALLAVIGLVGCAAAAGTLLRAVEATTNGAEEPEAVAARGSAGALTPETAVLRGLRRPPGSRNGAASGPRPQFLPHSLPEDIGAP